MKTIVCFGDSNTWGSTPDDSGRHPWTVRWPGILQQRLGDTYRIVEEGLGGRTTCWDDPLDFGRNGRTYLPIVLETHTPIDLLIIMLGTNDVKTRFGLSAFDIGQSASELLQLTCKFEPKITNILLVSPPHVVETENVENTLAFDGAIEKSKQLAQHYSHFAQKYNCHFFNAATVASTSPLDGIHIDATSHRQLADGILDQVRRIFEE